jgi:hypothetical protein
MARTQSLDYVPFVAEISYFSTFPMAETCDGGQIADSGGALFIDSQWLQKLQQLW